jgi:hypothetical protein
LAGEVGIPIVQRGLFSFSKLFEISNRNIRIPSIIRAMALVVEALRVSETSVYFTRLHDAISQNAVIFMFAALRT